MTTLMQGIGAQLKHDMQQARYYYQMVSKRIGMRMLQLSAMARLREIDREEKLMSALRQKAVNMARRMGCHPEAVLHLLLARAFENTPSTLYRMANKHHVAFHLRKAVTIDPTLTDAKLQLVKYERQLELLQTAGRYWLYNKGRW
ncbi:MAG TPA: hypothetical protein EYP10_09130 [Armatimonadetes bacterium]|nr:hypothetical protein [Armatimonadota bacterium]